ncbi:MAG: hypothetical protein K8E24_015420, partial [Methanobacterium paludis]|nr:hypothetical protein [Methanobacterium paludis]
MKRCRNCWTDNPDSAERCQKCGVPLNNKSWLNNENFRFDLKAVLGGILTAFVLFVICNDLWGFSNTATLGLIPIPFISGCVTSILAYKKEANTTNSLLNSLAAGFIIGVIFVMGIYIAGDLENTTMSAFFLILAPACAIWTLLGGMLGNVINVAIENGKKSTILIATILISVLALIGYGIYQFELYASYDNGAYGLSYDLDFMDIIQPEADTYLSTPYNNSEQRMNNLKSAKVKYERMINITNAAKPQSDEMIGNSSSSIKEEYAQAMGQYLQLKHQYCTEMYNGIQSEINGDVEDAQKHYQNAKNLIPQIQSQNAQITVIINKDP